MLHNHSGQLDAKKPLNWAKLFWWLLIDQQQWIAYRQAQGKDKLFYVKDEPAAAWLVSTLIWLPFMWIMLGAVFHLRHAQTPHVETILFGVLITPVLWWITAQIANIHQATIAIISGLVAAVIVTLLLLRIIDFMPMTFWVSLTVALLGGISIGVIGIASGGTALGIGFAVAGMISIGLLTNTENRESGGWILILFLVSEFIIHTFKQAIETETNTWVTRVMFGICVVCHLFLIWYCLLGGYFVLP